MCIFCPINNFHFAWNDKIIGKYLSGNHVLLNDEGTNDFAGNIVNYLKIYILDSIIKGLDWQNKVCNEENNKKA